MTLVDQLRLLVRLQKVDKVLFDLQAERDQIPLRLAELDQKEERLNHALAEAEAALEELTQRRKEVEEEADKVRARLRRAENRLMNASSQREYRAANAEIEEAKDALKGLDDMLVDLMERQEAQQAQLTAAQQQQEANASEAAAERKSLEGRAKAADKEIAKLVKDRGGLCEGVDSQLMDQYDFIRERRQGVALAPVSQGTCLACHMQLPPQQFNELQRLDKVMSCPSCRRIIYWQDAEPFESL
jgi:hypothetical protein